MIESRNCWATKSDSLLGHKCQTVAKDQLHLPGRTGWTGFSRPWTARCACWAVCNRCSGMGAWRAPVYLSILPVDQGIEHSAGASFAPNPEYFDSENIVRLAIDGGCNAVASTLGVLGSVARKYAHKIPFLVKINHNELLTYPNRFDQILFASVKQADDIGAVAVGATIYFGSEESGRQIVEIGQAFARAHELGLATVLWCYLRNNAFKIGGVDHHTSAELTARPTISRRRSKRTSSNKSCPPRTAATRR